MFVAAFITFTQSLGVIYTHFHSSQFTVAVACTALPAKNVKMILPYATGARRLALANNDKHMQ